MPAFIKTPKDEKHWSKAKEAANKSHSESEGDSYWAVVNSIYQKMNKAVDLALELGDEEALDKAIEMLGKASDEFGNDDTDEGSNEFDPSGEEQKDDDTEQGDDYDEYKNGEEEESHQKNIEDDESAEAEPTSDGDESE